METRAAYDDVEAGGAGDGDGEGGAGEMQLAEVADEHEGHYVDGVLQEAAGDHRSGEAQQPLRLRRGGALPPAPIVRRRREQRLADRHASWIVGRSEIDPHTTNNAWTRTS